jgi:hypothetical protein
MNRPQLPRCERRNGSCSIKNNGLSKRYRISSLCPSSKVVLMTHFTALLFSLLSLSLVPGLLFATSARPLSSLSFGDPSFLCRFAQLPLFCRRNPSTPISGVVTTPTPLGPAAGLVDESGVVRYSVRYGSADRWSPSSASTQWTPPYVSIPYSLALC